MARRHIGFLIGLLLILPGVAFPQGYKGQGRFAGTVTDAEGNPLEGVKVRLYCVRGQSGASEANGHLGSASGLGRVLRFPPSTRSLKSGLWLSPGANNPNVTANGRWWPNCAGRAAGAVAP